MAKTQSLECVRFYHYGLEIHTYVPGCSEKRRLGEKKTRNGCWLAILSYAVMWTHSRETKPERKSEMKRGDHVPTHVLLLLEKFRREMWFLFLDR